MMASFLLLIAPFDNEPSHMNVKLFRQPPITPKTKGAAQKHNPDSIDDYLPIGRKIWVSNFIFK